MKIKNILLAKDFQILMTLENGKRIIADFTKKIKTWQKSKSEIYQKLAKKQYFEDCFLDDGDLVFNSVKKDGKNVYFPAETVLTIAECRTAETKKQTTKNTLGTISAIDIMNKTSLHGLKFTGDWKEFLGEPEKNFYMVISAQPGHGKSTFCLKFANYLAKNFGKSIYITNEENEALIKRKLQFINDPLSPDFELSFNTPTLKKITELLQNSDYQFVFIDSSQATGIDAKELWELKKQFSNRALTVISRMTKDGKTRGSQNKEYDGDITINFVRQGVAKTIKNRYYEVGKEFILF